ncbi:MAG: hypothetical protein ABSG62_09850 [Terracidiphilus sp.]|jgi:hypothetical protein
MSDPESQSAVPETERHPAVPEADPEDKPSQGPSLTLIYSLIALALIAAIGFAMMIVLPFHHRR